MRRETAVACGRGKRHRQHGPGGPCYEAVRLSGPCDNYVMNPLDMLLRYPLFTLPPVALVREWLTRGQNHRFATGETIFQEGSPGSWGYVLLKGRVRIVRKTGSGNEVNLGSVQAGELFGEYALLPPGMNTGGCRAAGDCDILQFPLDPVRAWLRQTPAVHTGLKNWLQLHFLLRHLRGQAFLGFMSAPSVLAMLPHLVPFTVPPMRTLQADGLCDDHWFFIEKGELLLSAGEAPLQTLGAGATFGEPALAGRTGLPVAVALEPTQCLGLERSFFLRPNRAPGTREQTYAAENLEAPSRVRWIGQKDANDCGAAGLAMLTHYYDLPHGLDKIRTLVAAGPKGLPLGDVLAAAHSLSLVGQAVRIGKEQLLHVHVPAIAHLTSGHYVVVFRLDNNGVQIGDPATGLVKVSLLHFATSFSGYLLLLRPAAGTEHS